MQRGNDFFQKKKGDNQKAKFKYSDLLPVIYY